MPVAPSPPGRPGRIVSLQICPGHRKPMQVVEEEITKACSPCSRMDEVRPGLLREIAGRRGMLARVVHGGIISRGSDIRIIG